ncbi:MAG: HAD family hydrolase [Treponema sp.]|jgi:Cof subfamily protein (haloacid dehalogenase superfamily)|nr:HAD family hydrolase [Treponema sp.]
MNKLSNIKALAFDMDGTLLRADKTLSGRTLAALGDCMAGGIKVILSTGRGVQSAEPYRKAIGTEGPQVYYNGAEVMNMPSGKIIHVHLLDPAPVKFCLKLAREKGLYLQVYFPSGAVPAGMLSPENVPAAAGACAGEILLTEKLGPESEYYLKNSGLQAIAGNVEETLSLPGLPGIIKSMFITEEKEQEPLRDAISGRFGDSVTIVRSSPIYLEVLAKGVSKGDGLVHALAYMDIDPKNAIAFGDEENDLSMFAAAGYSAAPANAVKEALEAASFRIPSNVEDGVAAFLEEKIL